MAKEKSRRRVAYMAGTRAEYVYGALRGMLDYKERSTNWQLVSQLLEPFVPFPQLDLKAIDGVIGFFQERQWADAVIASGIPAVNISSRLEDVALPRVSNDDQAVGRMAAEHLLERGFVNLAFFSFNADWLGERRCEGFRRLATEKAGRECHVFPVKADRMPDDKAIDQWLLGLPKPVGVMGAIDPAARLIIRRATELGLRVPGDVAVIGVNNERWMVHMESVSMSSIELNERQIGFLAASMLDEMMEGKTPSRSARWIPPINVVTRGSTDIVIAEDPIVGKALKFISDHCGDGISVEDVLDELRISRRNFELRLKRAIGHSPKMAIFRAQIERAKKMLLDANAPMHRIAASCGFEYEPRFYVVFRKLTGTTPGEYRRRYRFTDSEGG